MNQKTLPPSPDIRRDFERVSPAIVQKAAVFAASILADRNTRPKWLEGAMRAAGVLRDGESL